jgi:hypothetical protein
MFWSGLRQGYLVIGQDAAQLVLAQAAVLDQFQVVDEHAFLVDGGGERRHRAGRGAADIGMVAARGDPEEDVFAGVVEDRRNHRDVGQMRAAVIGGVQRIDVAGADLRVEADHGFDRAVHRAEVHRHVRGVGDERALGIEDGAGEVEPFLDVHRMGGVLQRHAHLLGDVHEEVVEDLEQDRVGLAGAHDLRPFGGPVAAHQHVVAGGDLGAPAGLDDDGLVGLDDQRGAGDDGAGAQVLAAEDPGLAPGAAGEDPGGFAGSGSVFSVASSGSSRRWGGRRGPAGRWPRR